MQHRRNHDNAQCGEQGGGDDFEAAMPNDIAERGHQKGQRRQTEHGFKDA
jgi:hypothetical protein